MELNNMQELFELWLVYAFELEQAVQADHPYLESIILVAIDSFHEALKPREINHPFLLGRLLPFGFGLFLFILSRYYLRAVLFFYFRLGKSGRIRHALDGVCWFNVEAEFTAVD